MPQAELVREQPDATSGDLGGQIGVGEIETSARVGPHAVPFLQDARNRRGGSDVGVGATRPGNVQLSPAQPARNEWTEMELRRRQEMAGVLNGGPVIARWPGREDRRLVAVEQTAEPRPVVGVGCERLDEADPRLVS